MEDIFYQIFGTVFGMAILAKALYDAGKLPAGPPRATTPAATSPGQSARTPDRPETPAPEQLNLDSTHEPENTVDEEEEATIRRVVELRTRLDARRKALSALGLEITNLENLK